MKKLLFIATLLLTPAFGNASIYITSFESPDFGIGELHQQKKWVTNYYSEDKSLATIVDGNENGLIPPEGTQMLRLVRPGSDTYPAAGIIFHQDARPLKEFTASFKLAYEAKSTFPLFSVTIGNAANAENGVTVGIGCLKKDGPIYFTHGRGKDRQPILSPANHEPAVVLPKTFYEFNVTVHDDGNRFDVTVRQGEEVIASATNLPVPIPPQGSYNRLIVAIPGGSNGDQLFFDDLTIQ